MNSFSNENLFVSTKTNVCWKSPPAYCYTKRHHSRDQGLACNEVMHNIYHRILKKYLDRRKTFGFYRFEMESNS